MYIFLVKLFDSFEEHFTKWIYNLIYLLRIYYKFAEEFRYWIYYLFRTKFEEYDIPAWSLPSGATSRSNANTPSKVHRCKTCRKVFKSVTALAAHRKTHTAGFDTSRNRGFSAADFARRFSSSSGMSRGDPNALKPSEYEELLSRVSPHPREYPGYVDMSFTGLPHIVPDTDLQIQV